MTKQPANWEMRLELHRLAGEPGPDAALEPSFARSRCHGLYSKFPQVLGMPYSEPLRHWKKQNDRQQAARWR